MTAAGAGLDHDAIAARIPHAGPMCLLDQAVSWDESRIECTAFARPPRHPDAAARSGPEASVAAHPLAQDGRLPATAAIEYAAQAMALHGRLLQEGATDAAPTRGFLAGLRSVRLHCRWIADESSPLTIRVTRFAGDDVQVLYDFEVRAAGPIAQGRAVVILDAVSRAKAADAAASNPPAKTRQ